MATTDDFESETRERLATVEQQHENVRYRLERLREGQDAIMGKLDTMESEFAKEEDVQGVQSEAGQNTSSRKRKEGALKAAFLVGSVISGASGYVVGVML